MLGLFFFTVWIGPLIVKELKRIVESSEITKCVNFTSDIYMHIWLIFVTQIQREDDTNWPKKNIVGKQELEIRVGNDHIAFEVTIRDVARYRTVDR